jgi:hypothetical protein
MTDLEDRIWRAVEEGRRARSAYYDAIELPDDQTLGPPVPPTLLTQFEDQLGKKLPPSYRQFLSLHNGWQMAMGAVDLLSVEEMLGGPRHEKVLRWQREQAKAGDPFAPNGLVVGHSDITPTVFLLDPSSPDEDGEWPLIRYDYSPEQVYPSFLDWLESSVQTFRRLAEKEQSNDEE